MEVQKITTERNEIKNRNILEKINKTKSQFFEKVNKIQRPLSTLTSKIENEGQIHKIINGRGEFTTDST